FEMKLRGKFIFIIFITTIVSVFFIMTIAYMHYYFIANDNLTKFFKVRDYIDKRFLKVVSVDQLEFEKLSFPENVAITVVDADKKIIFNYNGIFPIEENGELYAYELFTKKFAYMSDKNFIAESFYNQKIGLRLILVHIEDEEGRPANYGWSFMFALIGLIVLIGAILSSIVLRSTNKSISTLEEAAKRISNGELDFEIEKGGDKEIVNLKESFDKMRISLIEERASRNRFIMAVSHDLKTPLTSIKGYLEALSDGMANDHDTQVRYFDIVQKKSRLLENRILELIDFAKMETGEWTIKAEKLSIRGVAEKVAEFFDNDAELFDKKFKKNITLDSSITALIDEQLFVRLFENLFNNAIRYTEKEAEVFFNVLELNGDVLLEIRDTGSGIRPKDLNLIFEPFYRVDQGRNSPGLGLGLSVVKSIIDSHGWKLEVTSLPREGTSFVVRIPRHLVYFAE
ncbi:MAG: HAMP domain-containing histidine kinase, partial [Spirochaetales bacterium]|nr:HAMP domain-containing histidine kinase [Spirochaetales bacterium]